VVLMPQLAGARAAGDGEHYSAMLDWGLRLVVLLSVPCALALLVFSRPLVAVLFHNGEFSALHVQRTSQALVGYGVGLVGLVAIKVLAPGYYAKQDTRTPMLIAVGVLLLTQMLNVFLVPLLQHAALTLTISIGALVNALWLLGGLLRRGSYRPAPGWGRFVLQVLLATAALGVVLVWGDRHFDWIGLQAQRLLRIGLLAALIAGAALLYFSVLALTGFKLRTLVRR
jgi:putative peptidoglycan lipid II flippase